jgi:hypothetical protein
MTSELRTVIYNRDFTTPPLKPADFTVSELTWSAYGGCDQGSFYTYTTADRLVEFSSLLRCPVVISDPYSDPVWWGYIDKITVLFERSQFTISLEDLYNKVKVKYSFISPDNRLSDQYETAFAENHISKLEYGTREFVIQRQGIDDDFALGLRDTFLELSAFPKSVLAPMPHFEFPQVRFHCKGWFHSLDWISYQCLDGFYANHGPGPGSLAFGDGTTTDVAQAFLTVNSTSVKYAYVMLRKFGGPASNITAHIKADAAGVPGANLATSGAVAGAGLSLYNYTWTKFTFAVPYTLAAATRYWLHINPNIASAANYYLIRTDENSNYVAGQMGMRFVGAGWTYIPSITIPGSMPDLMFRVVCIKDTGTQLAEIAAAGNQFFTQIRPMTSGVLTSPYRFEGNTCLGEINRLLHLGTSNQRKILATVNAQRVLSFYEQPAPDSSLVFMDRQGRFFTNTLKALPAYRPPIGQYASLAGVDRLVTPFDRNRVPTYFVDHAEYRS